MRSPSPIVVSEQKATHQSKTLRRFLQYLRPYSKDIPVALTLVSIGAATQSVGPFLIGWSIDNLIAKEMFADYF